MALEYKDYYKILGVEKTADDKAIKQAYRRLARKYHPDLNKAKGAADRFKEINEANEVLSDPDKRRRYDALGADWQRYAQAPYAARFLQEFAGDGPWAHLDIAGTAYLERGRGDLYEQKGATGYGVRLIAALAQRFAAGA